MGENRIFYPSLYLMEVSNSEAATRPTMPIIKVLDFEIDVYISKKLASQFREIIRDGAILKVAILGCGGVCC